MSKLRKALLPEWRYWPGAALAALIVVTAYGGTLSSPPPSQSPINQSYAKANDKTEQDGPLTDFWNWIAKDSISFFTFVLALVAGGQGFLILRQEWLARAEFNATHRPRVVMQQIRAAKCGSFNGKNAYIEIVLANAGESTATISEWSARLYFRNNKVALTPFLNGMIITCNEVGFEIPPGGIKQVAAEHREVESEHLDFVAGEADMYVAGNIIYSGPDKIERRTGFCRKWSRSGDGSWRPVRDTSYEYSY